MHHKPERLDLVCRSIRLKHDSIRTARASIDWMKRVILFHDKRPLASMGAPAGHTFLSHLAVEHQVAASTSRQA
jgi:hypothetical protein